jgi:predicted outer membrane repeat protein
MIIADGEIISASYVYTLTGVEERPVTAPLPWSENEFMNNTATVEGGGVYATASDLLLSDSYVVSNFSGGKGGGISAHGAEREWFRYSLSGNVITANASAGEGGGLYLTGIVDSEPGPDETTETQITGEIIAAGVSGTDQYNGTFDNTPVKAGSLTINAGTFTLTDDGDGTLIGTAGTDGTIDYNTGSWSIDLKGQIISDGEIISASYIYTSNVAVEEVFDGRTFVDNVICSNSAGTDGGGVYMDDCRLGFAGSAIISNSASGLGAGFYITGITNGLLISADALNVTRVFDNIGLYQLYNNSEQNFSYDPLGPGNVDARNVWWGTRSSSEIAGGVYDFFDDGSKGVVFLEPFTTFSLTLNMYGEGSVSNTPSATAYSYMQSVDLTADPSIHWYFNSWSNHLSGTDTTTNIIMTGDITVDAYFSPYLATNDVPLWWLALYGFTTDDSGAVGHGDTDTAPNWEEYYAGTNPTNENSVFAVSGIVESEDSSVTITWYSVSNRYYSLRSRPSLVGGNWETISNDIPATPPLNTVTVYVEDVEQNLYQIELQ